MHSDSLSVFIIDQLDKKNEIESNDIVVDYFI